MIGNTAQVKYGSGATLAALSGIIDIDVPKNTADDIESTDLDSTAKTFEPGLRDGGELVFTQKYTQARFNAIGTIANSVYHWSVEEPDAGAATFDGYVKMVEQTLDNNNLAVIKVTVKVTGAVTFT